MTASAEINRWPVTEKPGIAEDAIRRTAVRTCPLGSAACGFSFEGTTVETRVDGSGVAVVTIDCNNGQKCAATSEGLMLGMQRLEASHTVRVKE